MLLNKLTLTSKYSETENNNRRVSFIHDCLLVNELSEQIFMLPGFANGDPTRHAFYYTIIYISTKPNIFIKSL